MRIYGKKVEGNQRKGISRENIKKVGKENKQILGDSRRGPK